MNVYRTAAYVEGELIDETVVVSPDTEEEIRDLMQRTYTNAIIIVGVISTNAIQIVDGKLYSSDTHYYT